MPDIREEHMNDHFTKFHLGGLPFAAVIHRFTQADGPGADPHDHPWPFTSTILKGGYVEQVFSVDAPMTMLEKYRIAGETFRNEAGTIHRITRLLADECWTLILPEEWERKSGFYQFDGHAVFHRFWDEHEFQPYKEDRK
jgi:hypothetical protein